jgi:translation initiation factor IF-2
MAAKKILLIKIASEINIGKESIVLFLQSKGFNIENKPSATLTEEMVEAVYDKFKKKKKQLKTKGKNRKTKTNKKSS